MSQWSNESLDQFKKRFGDPQHLRNPRALTVYEERRKERESRECASERQQTLDALQAAINREHSQHGPDSETFLHLLYDYICLLKTGRRAKLCSGMSKIPHDQMNKINALYLAIIDKSPTADRTFGFTWKRNIVQEKSGSTVHSFRGVNAKGETIPFTHFLNDLISGKAKDYEDAKQNESNAHRQAVEESEAGELTFDFASTDENEANLEFSRYKSSDPKLAKDLVRHELAYLGSEEHGPIAICLLRHGIGNRSRIAQITGIDRRKVAASIDRYINEKIDIVRQRCLELGHDASDQSVKRLLGIGGAKSHPRGHVVETWETREKDPNFVDNGWNGHSIGPGKYNEEDATDTRSNR